jgi:hypothetical protein
MNQQETPDSEGFQMGEGPDLIGVPRPPRRWPGRAAPLAAVAVLALAGGAGVGLAVTHSGAAKAADTAAVAASSPTASPSPSSSEPAKGPKGLHRWLGVLPIRAGLGFGFGLGGMVHGQFTAPKSGGGYQTVDVQRGTVSAVSASSVTVKSADGFTATYAVTSSTMVDAKAAGIGSVKRGDTIFVTATVSGTTATAADVIDMTAVKAGRASFGFPGKPSVMPGKLPAIPAAPAVP